MSLDTWLKSQPDRCSTCGSHPPTQGHREGCEVTEAIREGERGKQRAAQAKPEEAAKVMAAIRQLAATGRAFSANEAREIHGVVGGVVGATFTAAMAANIIRPIDTVTSSGRSAHGKPVNRYIAA